MIGSTSGRLGMTDESIWAAFETVGAILTADDGTNTQSNSRDKLLNEILTQVAQGPLVAALWLCEWSGAQASVRLWNMLARDLTMLPEKMHCVAVATNMARKVGAESVASTQAQWKQSLTPVLNARLAECVHHARPFSSELFFLNANRLGSSEVDSVGILQFMGPADAIARIEASTRLQPRLRSTARSIAGWIQLNRARRLASSISAFTESVQVNDDIDVLVRNAVHTLKSWTNASEVRVYKHRQDGALLDLASAGAEKSKLVDAPQKTDMFEVAIRAAHFAPLSGPRSVASTFDVSAPSVPVQCAYIVPMGAKGVEPNSTAPFITVCCFARPSVTYIGGAFSETDRRIIEQISEDLSQRVLATTVSTSTHSLNSRSTELISRHMQLSTQAPDLPWKDFLRMAEDAAPSVRRCFFVDPTEPISNALKSGRVPSGPPELTANDLKRGSPYVHRGARNLPNYYIHPIETFSSDRRYLVAELLGDALPDFEAGLLDRIATEVRIAHTLAFQPKERLHQLAQVRHNLRGSLNAALSHAEALSQLYESCRDCTAEELQIWLVEKAQFRKGFGKFRAQATQLHELFENIKVAVSEVTEKDCQFTRVNLVDIIKLQLDTLDSERERRRLRVATRDFDFSHQLFASVDRAYISILFLNLIDNAFKYANRETTVELRLHLRRPNWIFEITNVGQPISGHSKEELWGEFSRVRNEKGRQQMPGTGLGLPAIRKIAKVHHKEAICDFHFQPVNDYNLSDTRSEKVTFIVGLPQNR